MAFGPLSGLHGLSLEEDQFWSKLESKTSILDVSTPIRSLERSQSHKANTSHQFHSTTAKGVQGFHVQAHMCFKRQSRSKSHGRNLEHPINENKLHKVPNLFHCSGTWMIL
ncbi:MAG: hypothetical protein CL912_18660 [Deltaproteobacteria bacterium]|nr:hypothetical protein [Deltaproteobacteria bacterium]